MENVQENFLGKEKVSKLLRMFSIPCVLSLIIQALYNLVDQIFIGHCESLGAIGNAATGIVYPLTVIGLAIGLCLGDGAAACMSLNQGKKDTKNTARSVGTAVSIGVIISVVYTLLCFLFKNDILKAIGAAGDIFASSGEYATLIIAGFIFFILACVLNPVIRADGSPKYAMFAMAIGALINIVLDPIFIYALDMGMTGASLATLIGQIITFILHAAYLFRTKAFKLKVKDFLPDFRLLKAIVILGISSFLTQAAIVIISIVNNKLLFAYSASSGYDTSITQGVITLAFKVFGIVISIAIGIAAGGQPILGYNYGAKKYKRVLETFKIIMISTLIVGAIATILFEFFPGIFLSIFGDGGKAVDKVAYEKFTFKTFRIYLGFILLTCLIKNISIFFQAIGQPVKATIIALSRDVIVLIPAAIILAYIGGIDTLLWSAAISDISCAILAIALVFSTVKKIVSLENQENIYDNSIEIKTSTKGVIITIARSHGAMGRRIGIRVAEMLGIPFYDKELTALAAKKIGIATDYLEKHDESKEISFSDLFTSLSVTSQSQKAQGEILRKIAEMGSCVIVGRAADHVLGDYPLCKVFIDAPIEFRKKNIMESYNDEEDAALKNIASSDKKRANFYYLISGKKWGKSSNYDLCINSEIGIEESALKIVDFVNKKNRG